MMSDVTEADVPDSVDQDEPEAAEKKPAKPKKKLSKAKMIVYGIGGTFVLLCLLFWAATLPSYGPIQVGICRTFAELQLVYPETFELTSTEEFNGAHRIFYTYMGPFGEVRSSMMSCRFKQDQQGNLSLASASLDREQVDPEIVAKFSRTIPAVVAANPDLELPRYNDGSLMALKRY